MESERRNLFGNPERDEEGQGVRIISEQEAEKEEERFQRLAKRRGESVDPGEQIAEKAKNEFAAQSHAALSARETHPPTIAGSSRKNPPRKPGGGKERYYPAKEKRLKQRREGQQEAEKRKDDIAA